MDQKERIHLGGEQGLELVYILRLSPKLWRRWAFLIEAKEDLRNTCKAWYIPSSQESITQAGI